MFGASGTGAVCMLKLDDCWNFLFSRAFISPTVDFKALCHSGQIERLRVEPSWPRTRSSSSCGCLHLFYCLHSHKTTSEYEQEADCVHKRPKTCHNAGTLSPTPNFPGCAVLQWGCLLTRFLAKVKDIMGINQKVPFMTLMEIILQIIFPRPEKQTAMRVT